jgi:hypothetical protein
MYNRLFINFFVIRDFAKYREHSTNWNVSVWVWHIISQWFSFINHVVTSDFKLRPFFANLRNLQSSRIDKVIQMSPHDLWRIRTIRSNLRRSYIGGDPVCLLTCQFTSSTNFCIFYKFTVIWKVAQNMSYRAGYFVPHLSCANVHRIRVLLYRNKLTNKKTPLVVRKWFVRNNVYFVKISIIF